MRKSFFGVIAILLTVSGVMEAQRRSAIKAKATKVETPQEVASIPVPPQPTPDPPPPTEPQPKFRQIPGPCQADPSAVMCVLEGMEQ